MRIRRKPNPQPEVDRQSAVYVVELSNDLLRLACGATGQVSVTSSKRTARGATLVVEETV